MNSSKAFLENSNETTLIQTELPDFTFHLARLRSKVLSKIEYDTQLLPVALLDAFGDALTDIFENDLIALGATQVIGESSLCTRFEGHSLRIRRAIEEGSAAKVLFFKVRTSLIPLTLDLVTTGIALLGVNPMATLPDAYGIYNVARSLMAVERRDGHGDLIELYEAYLKSRENLALTKLPTYPTSRAILCLLPGWSVKHLSQALRRLKVLGVIHPVGHAAERYDQETSWVEQW